MLRFLPCLALIGLWFILGVYASGCERSSVAPPAQPTRVAFDGYATSNNCRGCHPSQYESWQNSYHSTMTQYAQGARRLAPYNELVRSRGTGFKLFMKDNRPWVQTQHPKRGTKTLPIILTTGSHHAQIPWVAIKGRLQRLPFEYRFDEERWIPGEWSLMHPPPEPAAHATWTQCARCHSTRPVRGEAGAISKVADIGIACEACHGPASIHIKNNQNPIRRYASRWLERSDDIVNPERLSAEHSTHVCGQCHGMTAVNQSHAHKARAHGSPFRPGNSLEETHVLRRGPTPVNERYPGYVDPSYWPDGTIRIGGREMTAMIESACNRGGELSCGSCHSMHQYASPDDQMKRGGYTDEDCVQCHQGMATSDHTHHPSGSSGSRCYNCHMPYTSYGILKATRTHTIRSPSLPDAMDNSRPNACNMCHLDKTMAWTGEHLNRWYNHPVPALTDDQSNIAASILWSIQGDAGIRALSLWAMGWEAAQTVSGTDWMLSPLSAGLSDPYGAVRFIAQRTAQSVGGLAAEDYDFTWEPTHRDRAAKELMERLDRNSVLSHRPELLLQHGRVDRTTLTRLSETRDKALVFLAE